MADQTAVSPHKSHTHSSSGDALSRAIWAGVFIFGGMILLAGNLGYLPQVEGTTFWHWMALGAGGLFLLEGIIRIFSVDHQEPNFMGIIIGLILVGYGASPIFGITIPVDDWKSWWPLILIIMGISALAKGLRGK